jgi:4-amino-4-deoxychorismate lyase
MDSSARKLRNAKAPNLKSSLDEFLKKETVPEKGIIKFRVLYDTAIQKIEWAMYQPPQIQSLKLVFDREIDYSFKYANREALNTLYQQKDACDDILIVKEGRITDTLFCNVVFYNGTQWLTPAYPLLKGTQREFLLEQEIIHTADIRVEDLPNFSQVRLINALLPFETAPSFPVSRIIS